MLDDIKASLGRAGVPYNDNDIEHFVLIGYDRITIEAVILSIIRLYKSGQVDASCISAILNGLNTIDLKSAKSFSQEWQLNAHFGYHHQKLGKVTLQEYQQRAKDFMSNIPGAGVVQLIRSDGQYVRWSNVTGEFAIIFPDMSMKTYFLSRLGDRGWDYFLKQACQQN